MSDFLLQLFASGLFSSVLAGLIIWLSKSWITERLKNAIKHEYDEKLATHKSELDAQTQVVVETLKAQLKANSDVEVERLKSTLAITASEQGVRFAHLHEKRASVIAELYRILTDIRMTFSVMVSPATRSEDHKVLFVQTYNLIVDLVAYFEPNKLYLPEATSDQVTHFIQDIRKQAISFDVHVNAKISIATLTENRYENWQAAAEFSRKEIPKLLAPLEEDFRHLLGESALPAATRVTT